MIDEQGKVLASASAEYPLSTPRPGWAEQDPEDWWQACRTTIARVLQEGGIASSDVRGIGLSGQMHGSVFLDGGGEVIRPALLWCDQRTGAQCAWMTDAVGADRVVELTLNPVLTGFTAPKILWLRDNEPENFSRVRRVLLPKDYIRYRLTGDFATEVSDASGTALFNVRRRDWSPEILDATGIPREWLPDCFESEVTSTSVSADGAAATGLKAGTPVAGGGGDQAAGAVGSGVVEPGIISSSVGTSGVVFAYCDEPALDPALRLHTFCHAVRGKWHQMGVMLSAGGSLRWYRDVLATEETQVARSMGCDAYELIASEAEQAPPGCEGLIFLPYLTGERTPHPDPDARAVFFGLTLRHDRRHLARAVLEGVAYGLRDSFEILSEIGVPVREVRATGGGARSAIWRQIQADVTGWDHGVCSIDEGPAYGVCLLAGAGTGVWSGVAEACRATIRVTNWSRAQASRKPIYDRNYSVYRALYPSLREHFRALA